jgi:outer membrane protein insertion porin family
MTVLSVVLALLFTAAEPQSLQTPDPNRIEDVLIRNNRRIPSDTIKYNLQTKKGDIFSIETVRTDIRRLYGLGYFDSITPYEEEGKTGKIVVFDVKEKPTIRSVEYKGNKSITRSEILEKMREKKVGLSQESPYDPTRIKRAETVLKQMLAEKGHQNAKVTVGRDDVPPNSVNLTFNIEEGPKIKIEKLDIVGNNVFSDRKVKRSMKLIKEAGPLATLTGKDSYYDLKLSDDLQRIRMLYDEHGYVRANVLDPDIEIKKATVYRTLPFIKAPWPWGIPIPFWRKSVDRYFITIKIEENDQYRIGDVKITGSKLFKEEQMKAVLGLVQGEVFNGTALRKGFENLKKLYGNYGYINYSPVPSQDFDEQKKVVNLLINVDEDRQFFVNRISFSGNSVTRDKVIRREIMVDEGNVFNSQAWDMSLLRLNQLGYFEEIKTEDAEVKPSPTQPTVDINLKVKEKGRNTIGFNGGVSGIGGSFLGLSYETNNFLGFGETFTLSLQGGTRQSNYVLGFTEPYFRDRPLSLGGQIFASNFNYDQAREVFGIDPSQLPAGVGFEDRLNFTQNRKGFNLYASYPWKIWSRLGLNYAWEDSVTEDLNPATRDYFSAVRTQQREQFIDTGGSFSTFKARKITPTYSYNTTDSAMFPHKGQAFTATFEFTGGFLGGNVSYYRPTLEYRYFRPINKNRNTLAFRFLGSHIRGFSNLSVPFYERFFLGGDFDVRGFDFRQISPLAFVTRQLDVTDPITGFTVKRPFDDIVPVGGDTQGVLNFEYRIPLVGPITLAPFADLGGSWVTQRDQLKRQIADSEGNLRTEGVRFLTGTNSMFRASTGAELQVIMPVINAPFRLIFAYNPLRIDRNYFGVANGLPFQIRDKLKDFKFTVGRTF